VKCRCGNTFFEKYENVKIKREFVKIINLADVKEGEHYEMDASLIEEVYTEEIFRCMKCKNEYLYKSYKKYFEPDPSGKTLFQLPELKEDK